VTIKHISQLVSEADDAAAPPAQWSRPQKPDATVPLVLHRGHDGIVPFSRKVDGNWQQLGGLRASLLSGLFRDEFAADAMSVDSYFGLHGVYKPTRKMSAHGWQHMLPGMERHKRNVDSVRWLTCFHVDLDAYRCGLDSHGAIAAIGRMVDAGIIPSPSIYTLSRGVWALWRLHDREHTNEPLRAYPDHIMRRWASIQDVLHQQCASIGSDPLARPASTCSRIPGSVSSKSGERVAYMIPASRGGKLFSYTLDDMEHFFHAQLRKRVFTVPPSDRMPDEKRRVLGKRGSTQRYAILLERLGLLRDMRGGWKEGTRNSALFYVCVCCIHLGMDDDAAREQLARHLRGMEQGRDPVDRKEALQKLRAARRGSRSGRRGHVQNQTVADALSVTPDEAALLSRPRQPFPAAAIHGGAAPRAGRAETAATRQQAVERIVCHLKASGISPNGAMVREHLIREGLEASLRTVLKDMDAVGHPSARKHHREGDTNARLPGF